VWASSGMTMLNDQALLNQALYRLLFNRGLAPTIGEAAMRAKTSVNSPDIRRTWILLGRSGTETRVKCVSRKSDTNFVAGSNASSQCSDVVC
jgi:hypothetical protein